MDNPNDLLNILRRLADRHRQISSQQQDQPAVAVSASQEKA